ncbi:MAG: class I mannose-6-phosphate isomerase [Sedimentisphaerales bacterium]
MDYPIFFASNRVWRCYTGGALLDRFVGKTPELDGHLPEDWLASTVHAANGTHSQCPDEGLTRTILPNGKQGSLLTDVLKQHTEDILSQKHIAKFADNSGVLCKYLDSSVRLPIQCHPDAALAQRLFNSRFGKTECWHIINVRRIDGQEPYILMGFKPGVTREVFAKAAYAEDSAAMEQMLHKIPVSPGQTYFVSGRMPHAIGPGVFMLEVQEPSDLVITPERYCADVRLTDKEMWGLLPPEQAIEVFDFTSQTEAELLGRVFAQHKVIAKTAELEVCEIIGKSFTDAFGLRKAIVRGTGRIELPGAFAIIVVEDGHGMIRWAGGEKNIKRGDYFLQPAALPWLEYQTGQKLDLLICLPPAA